MRSLLALLGIVIGVATVIAWVALINGFQRSVEDSIRSMGRTRSTSTASGRGCTWARRIPDSLKQRKAFTVEDGDAIEAAAPSVRAVAAMKYDNIGLRLGYRGKLTRALRCTAPTRTTWSSTATRSSGALHHRPGRGPARERRGHRPEHA